MSVDCLASSSPKSTNKGDETCITSTFGSVLWRAESLGEGQRGEVWMDFWSVSGEKRKKGASTAEIEIQLGRWHRTAKPKILNYSPPNKEEKTVPTLLSSGLLLF